MIFITAKDHLQSNTDGFSLATMLLQFFTVFKPFGVILFIPPSIRTLNTERKILASCYELDRPPLCSQLLFAKQINRFHFAMRMFKPRKM